MTRWGKGGGQQQASSAFGPSASLSFTEQRIFATMGEALVAASRQHAPPAPPPPPQQQTRRSPVAQRPRHRPGDVICSNCFVSNWKSRGTCRQCKRELVKDQPDRSPSRVSPKPAAKTSPGKSSESSKTSDQDGDFMDVEDTAGADEDPRWQDLSISELKQEYGKLEVLSKQLKETHCVEAADTIATRMTVLRTVMQRKLPQGQRLASIQSSLRKTQTAREKQQALITDMEKKLTEAKAREAALAVEERQYQKEMDEFKAELVEDDKQEDCPDTDNQLSSFFQKLQEHVSEDVLCQGKQLVEGLRMKLRASSTPSGGTAQLQPALPALPASLPPTLPGPSSASWPSTSHTGHRIWCQEECQRSQEPAIWRFQPGCPISGWNSRALTCPHPCSAYPFSRGASGEQVQQLSLIACRVAPQCSMLYLAPLACPLSSSPFRGQCQGSALPPLCFCLPLCTQVLHLGVFNVFGQFEQTFHRTDAHGQQHPVSLILPLPCKHLAQWSPCLSQCLVTDWRCALTSIYHPTWVLCVLAEVSTQPQCVLALLILSSLHACEVLSCSGRLSEAWPPLLSYACSVCGSCSGALLISNVCGLPQSFPRRSLVSCLQDATDGRQHCDYAAGGGARWPISRPQCGPTASFSSFASATSGDCTMACCRHFAALYDAWCAGSRSGSSLGGRADKSVSAAAETVTSEASSRCLCARVVRSAGCSRHGSWGEWFRAKPDNRCRRQRSQHRCGEHGAGIPWRTHLSRTWRTHSFDAEAETASSREGSHYYIAGAQQAHCGVVVCDLRFCELARCISVSLMWARAPCQPSSRPRDGPGMGPMDVVGSSSSGDRQPQRPPTCEETQGGDSGCSCASFQSCSSRGGSSICQHRGPERHVRTTTSESASTAIHSSQCLRSSHPGCLSSSSCDASAVHESAPCCASAAAAWPKSVLAGRACACKAGASATLSQTSQCACAHPCRLRCRLRALTPIEVPRSCTADALQLNLTCVLPSFPFEERQVAAQIHDVLSSEVIPSETIRNAIRFGPLSSLLVGFLDQRSLPQFWGSSGDPALFFQPILV